MFFFIYSGALFEKYHSLCSFLFSATIQKQIIKLTAIKITYCRYIEMIDTTQLNIDWISKVSKSNRSVDKILVEKVIRALLLLEGLVQTEVPIVSPFIPVKGYPITVSVPCMEDLLGDKLTAFASNTTGIPYYKGEDNMSMEIIKQLYDIGDFAGLESLYFSIEDEIDFDGEDLDEHIGIMLSLFQATRISMLRMYLLSQGETGNG